jgi:hypothetical protein
MKTGLEFGIALSLVLVAPAACRAQAPTKLYAEILESETLLRHPDLSTISMSVDRSEQEHARWTNHAPSRWRGAGPYCQRAIPLHDTPGETLGELQLQFVPRRDSPDCTGEAQKVANEMQEVIPNRESLFYSFIVADFPGDVLAQRLTIETLKRYPDLLVLAFHVTAPGDRVNRIAVINRQKFLGRPSDEVDDQVAQTGKMIVQVIPDTHRMEVHMPSRCRDGSLIGTVVTVFLWHKEDEVPGLIARSMKLRDELQPRIPGLASLLKQ